MIVSVGVMMLSFIKRNVVYLLAVILPATILIARYNYQSLTSEPFIEEDGVTALNVGLFEDQIYQSAKSEPVELTTLYVFVDLKRSCPSQLGEAGSWIEPLNLFPVGVYDIKIFMPVHTTDESIVEFSEVYGVPPQKIVKYDQVHPLVGFGTRGLLKVFHTLEDGVIWTEYGNDGEQAWSQFEARLIHSIKLRMGQIPITRQAPGTG